MSESLLLEENIYYIFYLAYEKSTTNISKSVNSCMFNKSSCIFRRKSSYTQDKFYSTTTNSQDMNDENNAHISFRC